MFELLLKYKIARVVPMQDSFFYISKLPKSMKFSQEIITLNYEKFSPFPNPFIITYIQEKELYAWFVKTKGFDELFVIPEAFLLYDTLKKEQDGIYIFDTKPKKILIIKNAKLLASFTTDQNSTFSSAILKDEYQIDSSFVYSQEEFTRRLSLATKQLSFQDLYQFTKISFKKKDFFKFFIEKLSYPLISLFAIYIFITYLQAYLIEQKIENLTQKYQELKSKNTTVKQAIKKHNKAVKLYEEFVVKELHSEDPYKCVYDMYSVITQKDKATINSIDITNNSIRLSINTHDDAIKYLKRLNKIKYFKNVVIQNTHRKRDGSKIITFFIYMKEN